MTYPGGKNGAGTYQKIICQLPPHEVYIEPFLGGAAIMRLKRPAMASIGMDADADVVADSRPLFEIVPNLKLYCRDALLFLERYQWKGNELVYCDPPYLMETRSTKVNLYAHEMHTREEHAKLLNLLKAIPAAIAISGYWSDLYAAELSDWRAISFKSMTHGELRTEWLWMNYPEPMQLHDYRYLGENFRERERIKRKQVRWKTRLEKMPAKERYALLSVIGQLAPTE